MTNFAFENRMVQGADEQGKYVIREASQMYDFKKMRKQITGEIAQDEAKFNQLKELSDRAKRAREKALRDLREGGN